MPLLNLVFLSVHLFSYSILINLVNKAIMENSLRFPYFSLSPHTPDTLILLFAIFVCKTAVAKLEGRSISLEAFNLSRFLIFLSILSLSEVMAFVGLNLRKVFINDSVITKKY